MELTARLAAVFCLASSLGLAGNWSGALVDSKCYDEMERNVNPTDTLTNVDRDRDLEVRYCSPNAKTKSFALVQHDGTSFKLDPGGNSKAVELVPKTGKRARLAVRVTGEMSRNIVKVDSISLLK